MVRGLLILLLVGVINADVFSLKTPNGYVKVVTSNVKGEYIEYIKEGNSEWGNIIVVSGNSLIYCYESGEESVITEDKITNDVWRNQFNAIMKFDKENK